MIVGEVSYYDEEKDQASLKILNVDNYNEKRHFKPSNISFRIELGKLLCIDNKKIFEFDPDIHKHLIDIERLRKCSYGISMLQNKNCVHFILHNDIFGTMNPKCNLLKALKSQIDFSVAGYGNSLLTKNDIISLIEKYHIKYLESEYNKPGDYSKAWITIQTYRPSNLPDEKLDNYLDKILPKFEFTLAEAEDDLDNRFGWEIRRKLSADLGSEDIAEIKKLCDNITTDIKQLAILSYSKIEHGKILLEQYVNLQNEIIRIYS